MVPAAKEISSSVSSSRPHRALRIPEDKGLPALRFERLDILSVPRFVSVPALAPSTPDSTSEYARFCSHVNAKSTREQRSLSGASRTPGRVFREGLSDAAGTGSRACARGSAHPQFGLHILAADRSHVGAAVHYRPRRRTMACVSENPMILLAMSCFQQGSRNGSMRF